MSTQTATDAVAEAADPAEQQNAERFDAERFDAERFDAEQYDTEALAHAIAEAAWEQKARNLRVLDVRGIVSYTDFIIICHGTSARHAKGIAEFVIADLRPVKVRPIGIEGLNLGDWVLIDFGDAVLHVFDEPTRPEYNLESIYSDAPRLPIDSPPDLEDPEAAAQL